MMRESFEELANAALDGTATPDQRRALAARLETDARSRAAWTALEIAFEALARTRPVAPPPELKAAVMRAIHEDRAVRSMAPPPLAGMRRGLALRLASAFAAGCAAGILVWTLATGNRGATIEHLPAGGTMLPPGQSLRPLGHVTLDSGTARAIVETRGGASAIEAHIEAHAAGAGEMIVEFDPALEVQALDPIQVGLLHVSFAPGRVTLEFSGDLRCAIRLHGTHADERSVHVVMRSGNGTAKGVPKP